MRAEDTLMSFFGLGRHRQGRIVTGGMSELGGISEITLGGKDWGPACGFLDIHCHILPNLDEGPQTLEESMAMLELARRDGITGIVATPHIISGVYNNTKEIIERTISKLDGSANRIAIYMGAEIRIDRNIPARISSNELPLINDRKFILLELPTYVLPPLVELEKIVEGLRDRQISPIFAHPERNVPIMNDLSIMERLSRCGALFQMTAMSVLDHAPHASALKMIRKGYVHAFASDAHDAVRRPPILSVAYEMVSRKFNRDLADELFVNNPYKIVEGKDVR